MINQCFSEDYHFDDTNNDWQLLPRVVDGNGHTCYTLRQPSGYVLGVSGGSTARGATLVMWTDYNDPVKHKDQFWCAY